MEDNILGYLPSHPDKRAVSAAKDIALAIKENKKAGRTGLKKSEVQREQDRRRVENIRRRALNKIARL